MSQSSYMTEEGLAKLKKELEQLTSVERPAPLPNSPSP